MNHHDHDDLWQLLGKARPVAVSPWFAQKVVRAVRAPAEHSGGWWWLLRAWQLPALAACALFIGGGVLLPRHSARSGAPSPAEAMLAALPDPGLLGHLDELLDSEQNSVWLGGNAE